MLLCMEDEDVTRDGGLNPLTYNELKEFDYALWEDEEFRVRSRQLCLSIIAITCEPAHRITKYVCKAYIEAAKIAGYQMMFIDMNPDFSYKVLKTKNAESQFIKDPQNFLNSYGHEWFFCKCKRGSTQDCYKLEEYPKNDICNWVAF